MNDIPQIELASANEIKRFQEERLRETLSYVSLNSPFYRSLFQANNIDVQSIRSLDDLTRIPPTTKDGLSENNWEFLCVSRKEIVEYTSTSGTLGKPVTIALTNDDLRRLAYNELISFVCADGTEEDVYQLILTLDRQFMAGIAYYEGIRKLGAGLVRTGPGLPAMQWETIHRLGSTVLVAVPSFITKLIEFAELNKIDINKSSVKKIICIGESLRTDDLSLNVLGKEITDSWNVKLYSTYAATEMQAAFTECGHGKGGHLHPELLHVELLDDNNVPVNNGEAGEITFTTFGVQGMPLIRYKTGDMAKFLSGVCACGRSTLRIGPIIGRKQQMIKLKGTSVYPQTIFDTLQQATHVLDYVVEVSKGSLGTDQLRVHVVSAEENKQDVELNLRAMFQSQLRVIPEISFLSLSEIEKKQAGGRKMRRFIDNR